MLLTNIRFNTFLWLEEHFTGYPNYIKQILSLETFLWIMACVHTVRIALQWKFFYDAFKGTFTKLSNTR
jgi:hypothetical protein